MKLFIAVMLIAGVAQAQVSVDPVGSVDLAKIVGDTRAGVLAPFSGEGTLKAAYLPLVTLRGRTSGAEYLNLDGGLGVQDTKGKPILALGARFDTLLARIGAWRPVITTAVLPPIETGPTVALDLGASKPLKNAKFYWLFALKLGK